MSKGHKEFTGINIQWPTSELIISGDKTVETRTYPIPKMYIGQPLILVETPGRYGSFKARAKALIVFGSSFQYKSKAQFRRDFGRHRVEENSQWDWKESPKWGWEITKVEVLKPFPVTKRGIRFRKGITL